MALVEGNTHGGEPANDGQNEQVGEAPAIPDEAVAAMLGYVSDRASRQGGKVIDIGEVFIQAVAGEDTITGEATFEEQTGFTVESLVEVVRESARERGFEADDQMHLRMVDEIGRGITQEDGKWMGWASGNVGWVDRDHEWAARNVLHEAAHLLAGHDHGKDWREVYLGALGRVLDPALETQERNRVEGFYADED